MPAPASAASIVEQQGCGDVLPGAKAMANGAVDILGRQIDRARRGRNRKADPGMAALPIGQARDQPQRSKGCHSADPPLPALSQQGRRRCLDAVERVTHRRQKRSRVLGPMTGA
jgi:hypothetical protein